MIKKNPEVSLLTLQDFMRLTGFEPATFRVGELRHTMKKGLMTGFVVVMDKNRRGDEEGTNCAAAGIWRDCSDGGQVVVNLYPPVTRL